MNWLQPLAWWGLLAVAVPILIHRLAQQHTRRVAFPSLKFLTVSQTAAWRARIVSDWPLLVLRILIVVAAAAALAAPVFVSESRRAFWNDRVARAIVVIGGGSEAASIADAEGRASFAQARFAAETAPDAIQEAIDWLNRQPPAAREIVVVGELRAGTLIDRDLDAIPPFVGLRFLPAVGDAPLRPPGLATIAEDAAGRVSSYTVRITPEPERTLARYEPAPAALPTPIRVTAAPADQAHADALLRALLREGVVVSADVQRELTLAFAGSPMPEAAASPVSEPAWMRRALEENPGVRGGEHDGALVVRIDLPVTDPRAAQTAARVIHSAFRHSFDALETRLISAATLAAWSRPPQASPPDVLPADEGDRRWFWGAALVFLAIEQIVRRRRLA